jgi:hypothetical protein
MDNKINTLDVNEKKIKKCLKLYLTGKKIFDTDKNKAFEYFKQSLKYLIMIENKEKYKEILKDTETECNKMITLTVEQSIEKSIPQILESNLFKLIETGNIEELKKNKLHHLNFYIYDENGNTPLHKAVKFGDTTFIKCCLKLGCPVDIVNKEGYTLLEYACLERDPNIINFLLKNGSDMKKHLFFRDGEKKHFQIQNYMDIAILIKLVLLYSPIDDIVELNFLLNYFNKNDLIGFDEITFNIFFKHLESLLNKLNTDSKEAYLSLIRDEIVFPLKSSLECPNNKLELLLVYLIPFIDYNFNLTIDWCIHIELKYFFIRLLKDSSQINEKEKYIVLSYIWDNYIKNNLIEDEYLGNLISQWVSKIKV